MPGEQKRASKIPASTSARRTLPHTRSDGAPPREPLARRHFERELLNLQRELVIMQEYVRAKGLKVVVIFEGP